MPRPKGYKPATKTKLFTKIPEKSKSPFGIGNLESLSKIEKIEPITKCNPRIPKNYTKDVVGLGSMFEPIPLSPKASQHWDASGRDISVEREIMIRHARSTKVLRQKKPSNRKKKPLGKGEFENTIMKLTEADGKRTSVSAHFQPYKRVAKHRTVMNSKSNKGWLYETIFYVNVTNDVISRILSHQEGHTDLRNLQLTIFTIVKYAIQETKSSIGSPNRPRDGLVPRGGTGDLRGKARDYLDEQLESNREFDFGLDLAFPLVYADYVNEKPTSSLQHYINVGGPYTKNERGGVFKVESYKKHPQGGMSRTGHGEYHRRVISQDRNGKNQKWGYVKLYDSGAMTKFFEYLLRMGKFYTIKPITSAIQKSVNTARSFLSAGITMNDFDIGPN